MSDHPFSFQLNGELIQQRKAMEQQNRSAIVVSTRQVPLTQQRTLLSWRNLLKQQFIVFLYDLKMIPKLIVLGFLPYRRTRPHVTYTD